LPVPAVDYVDNQYHEENPQPAAGTIRRRVFFCLEESMVRGGTIKGALFMSSANVSFCVMACMVKYVSHLNIYTTTLFRFLIGLGILGLLALSGKIKLSFVNKSGLFVRGLMGGTAIAISFLSITKLGLIKAGIIIQLYPVFAAIFGWIILKERVSIGATLSIIGSFGGVCMLLTDHQGARLESPGIGPYEVIALFGALLGGLTVVLVKKLQSTDSTPAIFFAQCLVGLWIVLIPASIDTGSINLGTSLILVAIGVFATVGQLLSTDSYKYLPIATCSALVMVSPLLNCIAGMALFNERLTMQTGIGATIVVLSTTIALWKKPPAVVLCAVMNSIARKSVIKEGS
jgi:drug/metabolite transporter (DMT)-like permease